VGLPGVGKSTVGAALAANLGVDFVDSDDLILEATGRTTGQIIVDDGLEAAREIEATVVIDTLLDFGGVFSLGGGAVTTESVRQALADSRVTVVLLTASQDELLARIGTTTHRPLLAGDPAARLAELAEEREPFYTEVATLTVETDGLDVADIAQDIAAQLEASAE
jgi:shikimate kinase